MRWIKTWSAALMLSVAALACAQAPHGEHADAPFSFALIGDMPYDATQEFGFEALIADVNADRSLRFVLHAGDVKGGAERCDDTLLAARFRQLQQIRAALVYTPGDNEWTDCHRINNGSYLPTERLAFLRRLFFANPSASLGRDPIAVTPQSSVAGYEAFVENAMFVRSRVVFATLHVVGSSNGLAPWSGYDAGDSAAAPRVDRIAEFERRQAAVLAWIDRTFDEARARDAAGVLLLMQANPGIELPLANAARVGFEAVLERLKQHAVDFGKPVVLAHGDHHELRIDMPWYRDAEPAPKGPRFTRIQGFGAPRLHWVKVTVDPRSPNVFRFDPRFVPGNP